MQAEGGHVVILSHQRYGPESKRGQLVEFIGAHCSTLALPRIYGPDPDSRRQPPVLVGLG
jgi:hypothetical protein